MCKVIGEGGSGHVSTLQGVGSSRRHWPRTGHSERPFVHRLCRRTRPPAAARRALGIGGSPPARAAPLATLTVDVRTSVAIWASITYSGLRRLTPGHAQAMYGALATWARQVAETELRDTLPRRWAHSQGVAQRATVLTEVLGYNADLLASAAVLHDVGYAPRLAVTGFHPLDGARFLRDDHAADERLVRLVANHSFALLEAEQRGLRGDLEAEFPLLDDHRLVDALVYCDMTTTPSGESTSAEDRLAEIMERYGTDSLVGRFIRRASPDILAAVSRVEAALAAQPR